MSELSALLPGLQETVALASRAAARWVPALTAHLWRSTVAALVLLLLCLALGRWLGPRSRQAILLLGSLQLLVPSALLAWLLGALGWQPAPRIHTMSQAGLALLGVDVFAPPVVAVQQSGSSLALVLLSCWAVGAVALAMLFVVQTRRARRALAPPRTAAEASIPAEVPLPVRDALAAVCRRLGMAPPPIRLAPTSGAVAVLGLWSPTIAWPSGLETRLTGSEIEAVLAHEVAHVAGRDNLIGALQGLAAACFWFHPVAWVLDARGRRERELAGDEAVLAAGIPPTHFFTALLAVCRYRVGPTYAAVSPMALSFVTQRRKALMSASDRRPARLPHRLVWSTLGAVLIAALALWPSASRATVARGGDGGLMLDFEVHALADGSFGVETLVVRRATLEPVAAPTVRLAPGSSAHLTVGVDGSDAADPLAVELEVALDANGTGTATWEVVEGGERLQNGKAPLALRAPEGDGDLVAFGLHDADLGEVVKTFAKISGATMLLPPGFNSARKTVTVDLEPTSWSQALSQVLAGAGYGHRRVGNLVVIVPLAPAEPAAATPQR